MIKKIIALSFCLSFFQLTAMRQSHEPAPIEHFQNLAKEESAISKRIDNLRSLTWPALNELKKYLKGLQTYYPQEIQWVHDVHEKVLNELVGKFGRRIVIRDFAIELNSAGSKNWLKKNPVSPQWN